MNQQPETPTPPRRGYPSHPSFARGYERDSHDSARERFMEPLRREVVGLARGRVLEIGAGNGLNFAFYAPEQVESVEATEPDSTMLGYARPRAQAARVPIHLVQAAAEHLPFEDERFDSAVVTLVFCSVDDPLRGLSEVRRVLKPGGSLLMVEHVRSRNIFLSALQQLATPLTARFAGNCHWNRNTEQTVREAGFKIEQRREISWFGMPFVVLYAVK
jgi:ubiquinone/menaquinone biosynthesis C-methylase UbiE